MISEKEILEQEPLSPHLFSHKTHPLTKIVHGPNGIEYCCPYNGPVDRRGNPVGPNHHFESARRTADNYWNRKIQDKYQ